MTKNENKKEMIELNLIYVNNIHIFILINNRYYNILFIL